MPTTRPVVLSQVTEVLAATVMQFVKVVPFAVNVAVVLDAVAAALMTKVVPFVIELITAAAGMPGPIMIMLGHRFAVLEQTTLVPPLVVVQFVSTTGAERFDARFACRVAPAPLVVQGLSAPVPFQPFDEAIEKVSRNTLAVTCAPRSYVRFTPEIVAPLPGVTCAVITGESVAEGEIGLTVMFEIVGGGTKPTPARLMSKDGLPASSLATCSAATLLPEVSALNSTVNVVLPLAAMVDAGWVVTVKFALFVPSMVTPVMFNTLLPVLWMVKVFESEEPTFTLP
jgi:hypothetical protein